jgi:hypothetical protein
MLEARIFEAKTKAKLQIINGYGRGERIRTSDPLVPNQQPMYQAVARLDLFCMLYRLFACYSGTNGPTWNQLMGGTRSFREDRTARNGNGRPVKITRRRLPPSDAGKRDSKQGENVSLLNNSQQPAVQKAGLNRWVKYASERSGGPGVYINQVPEVRRGFRREGRQKPLSTS